MRSLAPIPSWAPITDSEGLITIFFRQLWEFVRSGWPLVPTAANDDQLGLTGAVSTTELYAPPTAGFVRVSYYAEKRIADGVSSSLQFTWIWTYGGVAHTLSDAALTSDVVGANAENAKTFYVDAGSAVAFSVNYASNTPGKMSYDLHVAAEQVVN